MIVDSEVDDRLHLGRHFGSLISRRGKLLADDFQALGKVDDRQIRPFVVAAELQNLVGDDGRFGQVVFGQVGLDSSLETLQVRRFVEKRLGGGVLKISSTIAW